MLLMIVLAGKILADANTLSSYEIKPNDQIVCMVQKVSRPMFFLVFVDGRASNPYNIYLIG